MHNLNSSDTLFIGKKIYLPSAAAVLILTLLVAYSYFWNIDNIAREKFSLALSQAQSYWNKDVAFRQWAARHGGVYVKPDERTRPNPALSHLPNRDVVTTDGMKLTLMNPAYMSRQMIEEFEGDYGIKGKITGKKQLNPANKPDQWQLKALDLFESGKTDTFYEQQNIDGQPYLRYMKAMYMTEGCVKCHGILGYKDGDLRGGVSVSIPLQPYIAAAEETGNSILATHLVVWLLGMLAIIFFAWLLKGMMHQLTYKAMYDDLTGLPNIRLFKNRLEQAFKRSKRDSRNKFAVCFMDLDRFKNLNDSRGHKVGDKLLMALAERISQLLRPGDTIARMGGDEFTLLLEDIDGLEDTVLVSERILGSFKRPFDVDSDQIYTNASIGICISSDHYANSDDMIRDADIAMYHAKSQGKGQFYVFDPQMHHSALETMRIENDLRSALDKQQMEVYYQPVIDLNKGVIEGFEALLRWQHPTLGSVSPERFIPVAEHTGQIKEIGLWVLEQACRQVREWNLQFNAREEFSIAVNLSSIQLTDIRIEEKIGEILKKSRISSQKLNMEVTETALIGHREQVKDKILKIRDKGISISIDDFGKGYCSLTYLQEFDFDTLKIDKDFIQDMGPEGKGLQLVRTLMLLARDLNMNVVAEGVETEDQLNRLRAFKCPLVQGFYYSRPLPASAMTELLHAGCHQNIERLRKMDKTGTAEQIKTA